MKVFCTLTREQASLYAAVVKDAEETIELATGIQRKGPCEDAVRPAIQRLYDRAMATSSSSRPLKQLRMNEEG